MSHDLVAVGFAALLTCACTPAFAQDLALRLFGHGNGDVDRVKIAIDPQVPADVGGDFTLEWWMKATAGDNPSGDCSEGGDNWITGNALFDRDVFGSGDFGDFGVSIHGGVVAFGTDVGGSGSGLCGVTPVVDGAWHHVAVTRDGGTGTISLFVDGVLDRTIGGPGGDLSYNDSRPTSYPNSDPFLVIGAEKHDAGPAYPSYAGLVDEVRLSSVVRYAASFVRPGGPFSTDLETIALYHFDEGPVGACTGAVLDSSGATGGPSDGVCSYGGSAPAGPVYVAENPFSAGASSFDAVVETPKPLRVSIPPASGPVLRALKVKVRRVDDPVGGGAAAVELVASDGDCPAGTVTSTPVALLLAPGKKANALVVLAFDPAVLTTLNPDTPTRCTIGLMAGATIPGNLDPSPSNNVVPVQIDVFDLGDVATATAHESFVRTVKRVKAKIGDGDTSVARLVRVRAGNGDTVPSDEVPGHVVTAIASAGDCPFDIVSALDFDRGTAGAQSSTLIAGGDSADAEITLAIDAADFASAGKHSPARCTFEVAVSGPGGDADPSNDVALVVIDVFDGNDD
jgi:hypothetical protein